MWHPLLGKRSIAPAGRALRSDGDLACQGLVTVPSWAIPALSSANPVIIEKTVRRHWGQLATHGRGLADSDAAFPGGGQAARGSSRRQVRGTSAGSLQRIGDLRAETAFRQRVRCSSLTYNAAFDWLGVRGSPGMKQRAQVSSVGVFLYENRGMANGQCRMTNRGSPGDTSGASRGPCRTLSPEP